jgi:hypothetical protein
MIHACTPTHFLLTILAPSPKGESVKESEPVMLIRQAADKHLGSSS